MEVEHKEIQDRTVDRLTEKLGNDPRFISRAAKFAAENISQDPAAKHEVAEAAADYFAMDSDFHKGIFEQMAAGEHLKNTVNTAAASIASDEQVLHQAATLASMEISRDDDVRTHTVDQAAKILGSTSGAIHSTTDKASKLVASQVFASDQMTATLKQAIREVCVGDPQLVADVSAQIKHQVADLRTMVENLSGQNKEGIESLVETVTQHATQFMTVGEAVTRIDDLLKSYESVTTDLQTKMSADSKLLKELNEMKNTPMVFAASMSEDMEKLRQEAMGQIKQLQDAAVQSNGKFNRKIALNSIS